jgi:ribonuclease HII
LILGGIDEAGRGSIMGPLVVAGISLDKEGILYLKSEGVIDSKKLSSLKRERLYPKIISCAKSVYICRVEPKTIDFYVNQNKLNLLESRYMTIISDNLQADKVIIDACDVNLIRFKQHIVNNLVNSSIKIYCFHKADSDNIPVSAASIVAKVTRDRQIEKIGKKLNEHIGSGYPSDPITKIFLKNNINNTLIKEHVRFSWNPVKCLLTEVAQTRIL